MQCCNRGHYAPGHYAFVKTNGCYLIKGSYKSFTTRKYQNQTRLNETELKQKNIDLRTNKNSNSYTGDPKDAVYV